MNARQRGNSKNEECKNEGIVQNEIFIGIRRRGGGGNKCSVINEEQETLQIYIPTATRIPPQFTNCQTMMTAETDSLGNAHF